MVVQEQQRLVNALLNNFSSRHLAKQQLAAALMIIVTHGSVDISRVCFAGLGIIDIISILTFIVMHNLQICSAVSASGLTEVQSLVKA